MARTNITRPPFDARHEFVVTPKAGKSSMAVGGVIIMAGQRFDRLLVDARRLRQMYEERWIAIASGSVLPAERKMRPRALGPADTTTEQPPAEKHVGMPRVVSRKRLSQVA